VLAISLQRIAHVLYTLGVPLLPRMLTEYAHERTGTDIHPGARIGPHFFIDHATGVVIGESCTIGSHVKIYQGVTLGAKSFEVDNDGHPIKGVKRHPDIEDHVTIYAHATILGGDTRIGAHSIIGGNVWLLNPCPRTASFNRRATTWSFAPAANWKPRSFRPSLPPQAPKTGRSDGVRRGPGAPTKFRNRRQQTFAQFRSPRAADRFRVTHSTRVPGRYPVRQLRREERPRGKSFPYTPAQVQRPHRASPPLRSHP
jgi:serine acetyltransferase